MQLREGTGEEVFFYIGEWSEVEGFGKFAIRWHKCAIWDLLYKRRLFIRCLTTYGNSIVMCPKVGFFLRVFDITNHMLSSLPCFNVNEPISCGCLLGVWPPRKTVSQRVENDDNFFTRVWYHQWYVVKFVMFQ